jgi:dTDP-glucose pyrophosphorylase/CBS domain-containing protein
MTYTDAMTRLESVVVAPTLRIISAVRRLDAAGTGALLLCDADGTLRGLVTDGDFRRAILRGVSFDAPVETIATANPAVGGPELGATAALRLMDEAIGCAVNQLPLVDPEGRAVGLLLRSDLVMREQLHHSALIMAGGYGTRLLPLTETCPKPMLPVNERPLLERTIEGLSRAGVHHIAISTLYLADRIASHFGDGHDRGVDIQYLTEHQPLGTAGALRLLEDPGGPMLVVNGDVLTGVRFDDMLAFHRREKADFTVGMRRCEVQLPYGVLECDGAHIRSVQEKPMQSFWVNAGIYVVEPSVRSRIPEGRPFGMTDLMEQVLRDGGRVAGFPIVEYWLDIGQPADYLRAQMDASPALAS